MKHKHHIIPRHAGGTDDPSNIIELTVEEHAEAHRLLFEQHGRWEDRVAWKALSGHIGKEEIIHEIHKNMNKGKVHSAEAREKMAAAKRGRKISDEHAKALHEGRKKSKNSAEHNLAISRSREDRVITEQTRLLMSEKRKNHPKKHEMAKLAGKVSNEKYKEDLERQQKFSERMKLWWKERKENLENVK
jgi:hypothetical protein